MKRLILALLVGSCLAQTTPNLHLNIPAQGAQNWDVLLNQNFNTIDASLFGTGTFTFKSLNNIQFAGQFASIQAAITAACNGTVQGEVWLPVQGASVGSQITVPNNCSIRGFGQSLTKLQFSSLTTSLFKASSATPANIQLRDFWIDGNSGTNGSETCIDLSGASASAITIDRVTCSNFGGYGIAAFGSNGSPASVISINQSRIVNGGLAGVSNLYGILISYANDVVITNNEITGPGITIGIASFGLPVTSSSSAIHNLRITGNDIHDIGQTLGSQGGGVDIGRVRNVAVFGNTFRNIGSGQSITYESVWSGTITGNSIDTTGVGLQGSITVKQPDTTAVGEVGSSAISITGNTIYQPSGGSSVIVANGGMQGISVTGNNVFVNTTAALNGILFQPGTTDANIVATGWGVGQNINITGNTLVNLATLTGNTSNGINITQPSTQAIDQIIVTNNTVRGWNAPVVWSSTSATNGITHMYIHDNAIEANNSGILSGDAHTYPSLYYWNNAPPTGSGIQNSIFPPFAETFTAGVESFLEQSSPSSLASNDVCYGDSTAHALKCSYNNGSFFNIPQVIASGTSTLTANATLAAVTSQTAITTAATGALTTDAIEWSYATAPTAGDALCHVSAYPTSANVNFVRTNPTAASQNVSAIVINWRVIR